MFWCCLGSCTCRSAVGGRVWPLLRCPGAVAGDWDVSRGIAAAGALAGLVPSAQPAGSGPLGAAPLGYPKVLASPQRWWGVGGAPQSSAFVPAEPGSPRAQPAGGVTYFSNLPPEQPEETVPLSPFHPRALPHTSSQRAPRKETPIKTRSTPESTLVLELEGTLVCCFLTSSRDADYTFLTDFQGDTYRVYVKLRPYVQEFLETISKTYEIFVFTTAKQDYAEKILDVLDPQKKLIRHCLYQQDCVCVQGYYVKDLAILERDLARTVALDDSLQGFPYQTSNCVPIPSWVGDHRDEELLRVIPLLGKLNQADDVRTEIRRKYRLCRLLAVD